MLLPQLFRASCRRTVEPSRIPSVQPLFCSMARTDPMKPEQNYEGTRAIDTETAMASSVQQLVWQYGVTVTFFTAAGRL